MRGDWGKALAEISTYSLAIGLRKMVEMNRQTRLQAEVFVTLFVLGMAAAATTPASLVAWPFDPAAVDRFITAQMARHRLPGLAVAITRGDQVVLVRGYGKARDGEPVTGQTQFRIASLSKSFTALAVLQLVEAGQIELDAPVARYLPGFALAAPSVAARITVRQLLNHTSGLADTGFANGLNGQQQTLADRVASLRDARPVDPPGAAFHYFDPNYQVLARLVEVVSGQAFDAYLQQHVFAPLAMQGSISALTSALPAEPTQLLAQGHVMAYSVSLALPELSGFVGGSGGVVSTASDLAHYLIAQGSHGMYSGHSVLSAKGVSLMQTPSAGGASSYAMGWVASDANGTPTIEHNGILSTFYADAVLLPQSGYGFVLLYNTYALTAATGAFPEIKNGMVALLTGQAPVSGKVALPWLGRGLAAFSAVIAGLFLWSLLRLPQWKARAINASNWKVWWGLFWPIAPALLLLGLPRLLALQTGRYFDHVMLVRAMPELIILLGCCGALGLLNTAGRLVVLARTQVLRGGPL
jgi:CubicO group peptidase (beta-lactamase class C family)